MKTFASFSKKSHNMVIAGIAVLLSACGGQGAGPAGQPDAQAAMMRTSTGTSTTSTTSTAPTASTLSTTSTSTGAKWYVSAVYGSDSNPGTPTAPFRTIQHAANLAVAGTTIYVGQGTYAETLTSSANGTASAHIRYVSVDKYRAIIKPVGAGSYTMWTVRGGYTDIDGFQIDGTGGSSVRAGIYMNGGNSSVTNTLVQNVALASGCDNRGGAGIVADQSRGSAYGNYNFSNNIVHHVGGGCGWIQGIYLSSSGKVTNNVVYNTSAAVNLGHDDHNVVVANNTLFNNAGYGVYFGGCSEAYNNGCPTTGIQIHNNVIYANAGGIQGPIASEDVGNSVSYNLVYGNRTNFDLASPSRSTEVGIISADPQFVNYIATGGGDYHLKSTSPAIGKGLVSYAPAYDINGKARGATIDMGAYETNLN